MNDNIIPFKLRPAMKKRSKTHDVTLDQVYTILEYDLGRHAEAASTLSRSCAMAMDEFDRCELEPMLKHLGMTWDSFMEQVQIGRSLDAKPHSYAADWEEWLG